MPPLNIAHRGGAGLWPENTRAAFAQAAEMGCDGAELDVQLTKDGEVVVFHDHRLKADLVRDADDEWLDAPGPRILDLTLEELEQYDVGRARPGSAYAQAHPDLAGQDGERVPLLADVVRVAKSAERDFWLQVELKTSFANRDEGPDPIALAEAAVAVLRREEYLHRTIFVGFDWPGLIHAKKLAPQTPCWFTTLAQSWFEDGTPPPEDDPPSEPALQMLRHWAKTGTSPWAGGFDAVNYGGSIREAIKAAGGDGWFPWMGDITPERVAEARALGLKVGAWTVDDLADMKRMMDSGLDAVCTDRPDIFSEVIR
ncbi:MAG TPA: glycerophosphodiester phosphodiesterase family protein [Rhizomicrobium sp.]|nr:glycerophosphodiester phosphodiesterase family protein [Rhizomicrobium sp.]